MSVELGRKVREQWQKVTEANKKYPDYETVTIPLTKLKIDSKSVYLFLKDFSTMLNENPNLFTMIHDGKNVLKAYAEGTKEGVYDSIVKIDLDGWEKLVPLDDVKATFEYVKPIAKQRTGIDVGLLKLGHVDFFKEFHPVFDEKSSNLESICSMYDCTRKVVDKNLIAFYPEPKLLKFLKETKNLSLKPETLEKIFEKMPGSNYGLLIRTSEGLVGITVSMNKKDLYIETPREEVEQLRGDSLSQLTEQYREKLGLNIAIGLESEALKDIAAKLPNYSIRDKGLVDEIVGFIKKSYGEQVCLSSSKALGLLSSASVKLTPSWIIKKVGYKIQNRIPA